MRRAGVLLVLVFLFTIVLEDRGVGELPAVTAMLLLGRAGSEVRTAALR